MKWRVNDDITDFSVHWFGNRHYEGEHDLDCTVGYVEKIGGRVMLKVRIKQNKLGDTRTATKIPTFSEFSDSNQLHCRDVKELMEAIGIDIKERGRKHDITKIFEPHRSLFYRELCAKIEGKIDDFTKGEWYPMHCKTERHHLNEHCPCDVNLIDVIEMICDCVCAGLARSGNVYPIEISSEILQKAIQNTVQMCIDAVVVETEGE